MPGRIACRLSALLGERKWKMMDLARATGLSKTTIFQLYHEKTTRIDLDTIAKICEALGCQAGELLVYVPDGAGEAQEAPEARRRLTRGATRPQGEGKA